MQDNIDGVRRQLAQVAGMQQRVNASDDLIVKAAGDRLDEVNKMIADLRPKVMTDSDAADEYMALVEERGHLISAQKPSQQNTAAES